MQEGAWRPLPPSAVAEAVWECYNAGDVRGTDIHWFVPEELEALDKQVSQDREAGRNARLDMAAESSADRAVETMEEMLQGAGFSREGELALAPARASL